MRTLDEYRQIAQLDSMAAQGAGGEAKLLILKNLALAPADQDWSRVDALLGQLAKTNTDSIGVTLLRAE